MTKNLTEGEPARLILGFTLPLIAGNIFQQLYAFVDTLIVGRFLGVESLAAVGCTGCLMFLMLGFVMGLTSGLSICTGQRFGAQDSTGIRKSVAACIVLCLLTSALLTIIGLISCRELLIMMQTPPEILEGAYSFISVIFAGITLFVFLQMQTNILRALGDSRVPTIVLAITLIINIILEPVAILYLGWGIPGAALATVASWLCGNLILFSYIVRHVSVLHLKRCDLSLSRRILSEHLRLALPMGFQASIIAFGAIILQVALNNLGSTAVAAYAAAQKVDALALMPMMSFGMAIAAYTAQNYGAQKLDRITEGVRKCVYMSGGFSLVAGAFNIFFGSFLTALFVGADATEVIAYGQTYLTVNGSCYWILSLLFIFRSALQGLGQSVVPTIAGVMELIMRAAAAIFLVAAWGFLGACWANPLAWLGSAVPLIIAFFFTRRSWKHSTIRK